MHQSAQKNAKIFPPLRHLALGIPTCPLYEILDTALHRRSVTVNVILILMPNVDECRMLYLVSCSSPVRHRSKAWWGQCACQLCEKSAACRHESSRCNSQPSTLRNDCRYSLVVCLSVCLFVVCLSVCLSVCWRLVLHVPLATISRLL